MIENINGNTASGNVATAYVDFIENSPISTDNPKDNKPTSTQEKPENEAVDNAGGTPACDGNVSTAYVDL